MANGELKMKRNVGIYVLPVLLIVIICAAMIYNPGIWAYLIERMLATPVFVR